MGKASKRDKECLWWAWNSQGICEWENKWVENPHTDTWEKIEVKNPKQ